MLLPHIGVPARQFKGFRVSGGGQGRADIGSSEVISDKQQRAVELLGRGIGKAVAEIQGSGVEAFAEALTGCGRAFCACGCQLDISKLSEAISPDN
jgi:hypothetical protein